MRICKLLSGPHKYAIVHGLTDTPTGVKARLEYGNGDRDLVPVQSIRMLQDEEVPCSKGSIFDGI